MSWQEPQHEPTPDNIPRIKASAVGCLLAVVVFALFFWWSVKLLEDEQMTKHQPIKQTTLTPPTPRENIVVNITGFSADPLTRIVTIKGKVKNFTSQTFNFVQLRFEFYDRNKNLVHTETRFVVALERFRPGDVRSFAEQFFDLPDEAKYVQAYLEEAQ